MTKIELVRRFPSGQSHAPVSNDQALETGNIAIDQDNFTEALERRYDVRGFVNMHLEIKNTGGSNGLTYSIGKASKEVENIEDLVDADFTDLLTEFDVAFGITDVRDIVGISPESTSIRIQVKRQTSSMDTTLAGVASFN